MKRLNFIFFLLLVFDLFGQDNRSADVNKIIRTLINHETFSIVHYKSFLLLPKLDTISLQWIRHGLSQNTFIKNNGKSNSDTLALTADEIEYIDSSVSLLPNIWTSSKLNTYGFSNYILGDTIKVQQQQYIDFDLYQIMQPIFIRNNTIAFAFYKSVGINFHMELSIMKKQDDDWVIWSKVIIGES